MKSLVSQTLDPILTAYLRDVAQSSSMFDLLTKREELQRRATLELGQRFANYDKFYAGRAVRSPTSGHFRQAPRREAEDVSRAERRACLP